MTIELSVNGKATKTEEDPDMPLLWFLRDSLGLKGTKFGCGISLCGACTVHVDGEPVRSCVFPLAAAAGKAVTTIEGLGGSEHNPVQRAWVGEQVPQCGYCQSGQVMSAASLLAENPKPDVDEINDYMSGNACRCATYQRIRAGIQRASEILEA